MPDKKNKFSDFLTFDINIDFSLKHFTYELIQWYQINKNDYFFRKKRDPYFVWISEIALQQTRIEYGEKKIEKFLKRFPDIKSLGKASEDEVLKNFSGLGYYSRAKNIRKAAEIIIKKYNGKFPDEYDEIIKLPSIGDYTASAIMSLAFGKKYAAVDANLSRIVYRIFYLKSYKNIDFNGQKNRYIAKKFFENLMNYHTHPGDVNEAAMEFGQKICRSKNSLCNDCPLNHYCLSYKRKDTTIPPKKYTDKRSILWIFINIHFHKNGIKHFLLQKNSKDFPFLREHIMPFSIISEIPLGEWLYSSSEVKSFLANFESLDQLDKFKENYLKESSPKPHFRHTITNNKIFAYIIDFEYTQKKIEKYIQENSESIIVTNKPTSYAVSSASSKIFKSPSYRNVF